MNRLRSALLILTLAAAAACGDDSTGLTSETVAGTYHATQIDLTFAGSNEVLDAMAIGATAVIVLTPQGTTTGTLVVPASLTEDRIDDDVIDLTGTYTVTGNTLTFQGPGDSFIRDVVWTIGNGTLTTTDTQPEGTLVVTLTRSCPDCRASVESSLNGTNATGRVMGPLPSTRPTGSPSSAPDPPADFS